MLNQTIDYDANVQSPSLSGNIGVNQDPSIFLMSGVYPANLADLLIAQPHFRDVLVGSALNLPNKDENILNTLTQRIQTIKPGTKPEELRPLCTAAATIAYGWGEVDLAKKLLLRIDPATADRYTKVVYNAICVNKMETDHFKRAIVSSLDEARAALSRLTQ